MQVLTCNESLRRTCRQIIVPSISALSSLADVKVIESSGCFAYAQNEQPNISTKNRFIIWRSIKSQLFLEEHSFDTNLSQNSVCIQFQNSVVLPGTQITETSDRTIILVSTVSSVHRIVLPHPRSFQRKKIENVGGSMISVLSEINVADLLDPKNHLVLNINGSSGPTASACVLSWNEEALFALGRTDGTIILVTLPHVDEEVIPTQDVLRQSSTVKRIWSGIVNPLGFSENVSLETCSSLLFHIESKDVVLYSISCDYKLRAWSCKNKDVLATLDVLNLCPERQSSVVTPNFVDGEKWRLRKTDVADTYFLTVFMSVDGCCQFLIILPSKHKGKRTFTKILCVEAFEFELIDFILNPTSLWSCWRSNDQIFVKYLYVNLNRSERSRWLDLDIHFCNPAWTIGAPSVSVDEIVDFLFEPGLFSYEVLFKAIKICCKDFHLNSSSNDVVQLKIHFEQYLRKFAANVIRQKRILDEKVIQQTLETLGESLISCIFQYHKASTKILGLFFLPFSECLPGIIAVDRFGFVLASDKMESILFRPTVGFDEEESEYVWKLFSLIADQYSADNNRLSDQFDRCLLVDKIRPLDIARDHQAVELFNDKSSDIVSSLRELLSSCETQLLIVFEELTKNLEPNLDLEGFLNNPIDFELENSLKSSLWKDLLTFSVKSIAGRRFEISRNALMILSLCDRYRSQLSYSQDIWSKLENVVAPRLNDLCQMYNILRWFVNLKNYRPVDDLEKDVERLANLRIAPVTKSAGECGIRLLLNDFFDSRWFSDFRMVLFSMLSSLDVEPANHFVLVTQQAIELSVNFLWPTQNRLILFDFLAEAEEHQRLVELCNFLHPWCQEFVYVRFYLKGCSLLRLDRPNEAIIEFRKAFVGLEQMDSALILKLNLNQYSSDDYGVHYYREVSELFEQRGFNSQVIELCRDGLGASCLDNQETHFLWTLLFKHYLESGKIDEAFSALNRNPEWTSRKTCLRLFVVRLLEMKQYEKLISYQYSEFEQEFVEFLEQRARTVDVLTDNYYEVLCSYFINKSDYRRAAVYFYELAQRLKMETNALESLRLRVSALCGCVANLSLCQVEYPWIQTNLPKRPLQTPDRPGASPKRSSDGEELPSSQRIESSSIEIVEFSEIRKELMLAKANLIAASKFKIGYLSPSEGVTHLINLKEFDAAASLAVSFELPIENILEGLTLACLNVGLIKNDQKCSDFDWIEKNRAFTSVFSTELNASDLCWRILECYLEHFSKLAHVSHFYQPSLLYRCVSKCLLMHSRDLPTWLTSKFKKIDFPEYLRQLIEFDRLNDAQSVLCDYIKAILGYGSEEFALKNVLHANHPPVWLPYSCIDQLLVALSAESSSKNSSALEKKTELEGELKNYFHQLDVLSTV